MQEVKPCFFLKVYYKWMIKAEEATNSKAIIF